LRLGPSIPGVYVNPGFWTPKIRVLHKLTCLKHILHLETPCNDMNATTNAPLGLFPLGLRQYKTK
jgi:hypothetical protein